MHRCRATHWSMVDLLGTTPLKKSNFPFPWSHQLSQVPWVLGDVMNPLLPHTGLLTGLTLCRQPQLLCVHECCGPVMSKGHSFASVFPDFCFLQPFNPFLDCYISWVSRRTFPTLGWYHFPLQSPTFNFHITYTPLSSLDPAPFRLLSHIS